MDNTITQNVSTITQQKFEEDTKRWREEDILKLANHFHKLQFDPVSKEQFKRSDKFEMVKQDVTRFKNRIKEISGIKIYLALEKPNVNEHTFYIILKVTYSGSNDEEYFKLISPPVTTGVSTTEIVPETFKEMICENWDSIESHLIDDLFTAKDGINRVRVHYFYISDNIIDYIKDTVSQLDITAITLYAGIDMNKFYKQDLISFTPVLGFRYNNTNLKNPTHVLGLKGVLESTSNEIYFEYSSPCPPTCPTN